MGRHGYNEDYCDHDPLLQGRWRGQVLSAIRGKRGQAFLRELAGALDAMPDKRLIRGDLVKDGEHCTLGVVGAQRGMKLETLDPEDYEILGTEFGIAHQLVQEIEWENDDGVYSRSETPEQRWKRMRDWVESQIKIDSVKERTDDFE